MKTLLSNNTSTTTQPAHRLAKLAIAFGVMACAMSCTKNELTLPASNKVFNPVTFRNRLITALNNSATVPRGYAIVISQNGNWVDTFATGSAHYTAGNKGFAPMYVNQELNIASVSKTITAVAVLQLLTKNELEPGDKIGQWLPAYWNAKPVIKDLTFKELLTHSSGLLDGSHSWDSIRATVKRGLDDASKPTRAYANINFTLFRAIIPFLIDKNAAKNKEASYGGNIAAFELWMSQTYTSYVQQRVFAPIGMNNITCKPSVNTAQMFSEFAKNAPAAGIASATPGDWSNAVAGGGFYMSTMEMARFMAFLAHTNNMLTKDEKTMMDNLQLGWDTNDSQMTDMGQSYGKGGALYSDANNTGDNDAGDPGLQTLVVQYPKGIELSWSINSIPGNWRNLSTIARNAYNQSWETK